MQQHFVAFAENPSFNDNLLFVKRIAENTALYYPTDFNVVSNCTNLLSTDVFRIL